MASLHTTGRRFFDDAALESEVLARIRLAVDVAGLWDELATDWIASIAS